MGFNPALIANPSASSLFAGGADQRRCHPTCLAHPLGGRALGAGIFKLSFGAVAKPGALDIELLDSDCKTTSRWQKSLLCRLTCLGLL